MNEQIKQLAEQAKAQYCDLGDASCFKRLGLVEAVVFTPEDLEKFAELIVRECAKYVDVMWPHQKEFKGTLDVGKGLKAKFGVEE